MPVLRVPKNRARPDDRNFFKKWVDEVVKQATLTAERAKSTGTQVVDRTGEVVYDVKQKVENHFKPPRVDTHKQRGFPAYMTDANPDVWTRSRIQGLMGRFDPKTLPKQLPPITAYRADPAGKFGGKEGLETQPVVFPNNKGLYATGQPAEIYAFTRILARAKKYGVPQLSAIQLASMVLKEGRANYGSLSMDYDISKKADIKLKERLIDEGAPPLAAEFAINVKQKMEIAKRLGITFEEAWNGTGRNFQRTSGKEYAATYPAYIKAAQHPKNKQLVDLIQSALNAEKPKVRRLHPPVRK